MSTFLNHWHQTNRSNNRSPSGFHSHDQTACFSTQKRFHNGTWQDPFQIMSWCCPNSSLNSAIINLRQTFSDLNCVEWILDIFFSGSFNLRATFCKRWVIAPTLRSWIERRTQDRYGLGLSKLAQVRFSWVPLRGGPSTDWKCSTQIRCSTRCTPWNFNGWNPKIIRLKRKIIIRIPHFWVFRGCTPPGNSHVPEVLGVRKRIFWIQVGYEPRLFGRLVYRHFGIQGCLGFFRAEKTPWKTPRVRGTRSQTNWKSPENRDKKRHSKTKQVDARLQHFSSFQGVFDDTNNPTKREIPSEYSRCKSFSISTGGNLLGLYSWLLDSGEFGFETGWP